MKPLFDRSSEEEFNPKPAVPSHLCHSLIDLLNQLSPLFKRNFSILQKKRTHRHPFERVATPYQLYAWTSPQIEHTIDAIRAEDSKINLVICYNYKNPCRYVYNLCLNLFLSIFFKAWVWGTYPRSDTRLEWGVTNNTRASPQESSRTTSTRKGYIQGGLSWKYGTKICLS